VEAGSYATGAGAQTTAESGIVATASHAQDKQFLAWAHKKRRGFNRRRCDGRGGCRGSTGCNGSECLLTLS